MKRTSCSCDRCKAACRTMPAYLVPGDLDAITAQACPHEAGSPEYEAWVADHFTASEGPLVLHAGRPMRVPTIVPAQQSDGRCVFLDDQDRCAVHANAPYGCRYFNVCSKDSEAEARSVEGIAQVWASHSRGGRYTRQWLWLAEQDKVAPPLSVRREAFAKAIKEIEDK